LIWNEEVLQGVNAGKNSLLTVKKRIKANWIDYIFLRNCTLRVIAVKTEVTGRRGRRRKQVLGDLKETGR
jgi:hypothetical protein